VSLVACLDTHPQADHVTGSAIGLAAMAGAENVFAGVANLRGGLRSWRLAGCPLAD